MIAPSFPTETKSDISVIQLNASEEHGQMLRKVVNFLEGLEAKELKSESCHKFANRLDKIFFWFYSVLGTVYFSAMIYVMVNYECKVNHFDFWY